MEKAPPEPGPINDRWWRKLTTLAFIRLLRRHGSRAGTVLYLTSKLCVKYGYFVHLSEAATLQFIANHTSIPVPKVYCAFKYKDWTYIVMERIEGQKLAVGWLKRSQESKERILIQLRQLIAELRSIPPPKDAKIANAVGGTIYDGRLSGGSIRRGPFKDIQEFHLHLREGLEAHPGHAPEVRELFTAHDGTWPICFTHGDLSSLNILVRDDCVVGIVDWETAGWYPSYWEYTTARNVNPRNEFWREEIDKFLEPMPKELAMEHLRMKYFGDVN